MVKLDELISPIFMVVESKIDKQVRGDMVSIIWDFDTTLGHFIN